jgi:hypothetical protein
VQVAGVLAVTTALDGDPVEAVAMAEHTLHRGKSMAAAGGQIMFRSNVITAYVFAGAWPQARAQLIEQLHRLRRLGSPQWVGETLEMTALLLEGTGRRPEGSQMLASAAAHRLRTGEATGGGIPTIAAALAACAARLIDLPAPAVLPVELDDVLDAALKTID